MASTIIGYFEDYGEAQQAEMELLSAGFSRDRINLVAQQDQAVEREDRSFWDEIKDAFGFSSESDRATYAEASRHGALLSAEVPDDRVEIAADILERHHPVDIDRRAEEWRASGWTGSMPVQREQGRSEMQEGEQREAIPVVEEQLKVGKRAIKRGGVRIHKEVTETPVEEQVRLRDEDVHVERRPVDRPVTDRDRAFEERTIEMTETDEEAVVSKEARVVEEVEVSKDVHERIEPVRDTVRREDVRVENLDDRRGRAMPGRDTEAEFRSDFDRNYAAAGANFDDYRPAYEFGHDLADNDAYRGRSWTEIESDARDRYEQTYPGRWTAHRDAIRTGYERRRV